MEKLKLFLSYSHKDMQFMYRVRGDLEKSGFIVWTDDHLIPGTESWKKTIEKEIEHSDCLIALYSPDAKQSDWVEKETTYAKMHQIPTIPVLIRGPSKHAIPLEYANTQYADLRGSETEYLLVLDTLIESIRIKVHNNIKDEESSELEILEEKRELAQQPSDDTEFLPEEVADLNIDNWIIYRHPPGQDFYSIAMYALSCEVVGWRSEALKHIYRAIKMESRIKNKKWMAKYYGWGRVENILLERLLLDRNLKT